jgi:hypothetical protein
MHSRTLAPCDHAVCCVLCVGCSAEAGSHSSRPHSSPTLIVQERQSFSHMANGHSAGVDRPKPLANVCERDLQIPEIGYQTCNIKSGPAAFGRPYQLPLLSTSRTAMVCACGGGRGGWGGRHTCAGAFSVLLTPDAAPHPPIPPLKQWCVTMAVWHNVHHLTPLPHPLMQWCVSVGVQQNVHRVCRAAPLLRRIQASGRHNGLLPWRLRRCGGREGANCMGPRMGPDPKPRGVKKGHPVTHSRPRHARTQA